MVSSAVIEKPDVLLTVRGKYRSLSVHFSSTSTEWATPDWLFNALNAKFGFTLDPCSSDANAKCSRHFTIKEDGLTQDWEDNTVFMNPPYGREIGRWMRKAYESSRQGAIVVCLIPSRTDTQWWHRFAMRGEIRFLRGRVRFEEAENGAPFPSAVVVFRPPEYQLGVFRKDEVEQQHRAEA